ncbi:hypothetical protein ACOXXX_13475 [Thalassococcus sp. BH17M4-6]|uniref:hypothetical protein n=1 Tax=Thalassococcus sp. BH17M4-6 TaxID=3413148 RepID=UPI003BBA10B7
MKRFLIATALTASMATAGFAATEQEKVEINSFLPTVNVEAMSDAEVAQALQIINGGDNRSDKLGKLNALVSGNEYMSSPGMASEAEMEQIKAAAPGVDVSKLSQAQIDTALALISSTDAGDVDRKVQAVLMDNGTPMAEANTMTEGEMVILERYLTPEQIASLTESQLNSALAIVYGGGSPTEISSKLEGLVM